MAAQVSEAGDEESTQRVRRSHKPQHWKKVTNSRLNKSSKNGEVSEWLKEHAWKVCIRQRIEGSNPSLTAIFKEELQQCGFFCIWNSRNRLWEGENPRGFEPSEARQHRAAMAPKGGAPAHNPSLTAIFKEELQQCGFFCTCYSMHKDGMLRRFELNQRAAA